LSCNKIIKPEFTKEQIAECEKCKYASAKIQWCGLFGCWIQKPSYPSSIKMAGSFAKESAKYIKAGRPKRSDEEQAKLMLICEKCEFYEKKTPIGPRCRKCGCCMKIKTRWATAHCPIGKW